MQKRKKLSKYIDEIIDEVFLEIKKDEELEETTTGAVAGYNTPNVFGDNSKKSKDKTKTVSTQAGYEVIGNDVHNISEATYNTKSEAMTAYFKGKLTSKELNNIAHTYFKSAIATKPQVKAFLKNNFLLSVTADSLGISKETLIKRTKDLLVFAENANESNTAHSIKEIQDLIPGGLAKGLNLGDIARKHNNDINELTKEFQRGIKVEIEHTTDINLAKEITLDHLFEDPKYYTKLATVEDESIAETTFDNHKIEFKLGDAVVILNKHNSWNPNRWTLDWSDNSHSVSWMKYKFNAVPQETNVDESINNRFNVIFENIKEGVFWPKSKLPTSLETVLRHELNIYKKGMWHVVDKDLYYNGKRILTIKGNDSVNSILKKLGKKNIKEVAPPKVNRWLNLKNDKSISPHKKLAMGLKGLQNQLQEVEKFLGWYNKIKNINELESDSYWKRTNRHIYKIKERLVNIARTLKEIEK